MITCTDLNQFFFVTENRTLLDSTVSWVTTVKYTTVTELHKLIALYASNFKVLNHYVATKATYIRLLHGKIGILEGFFRP